MTQSENKLDQQLDAEETKAKQLQPVEKKARQQDDADDVVQALLQSDDGNPNKC